MSPISRGFHVRVIDVSVPVRPGMVTYPGDPEVELVREHSIADGAAANVSRLDFGVHTGTHVDAPLHFIEGAPAEARRLGRGAGPGGSDRRDMTESRVETRELDALRAGDEAAFMALVERYNASLLRVAQIWVSSRAVAEEVVQETWVAVLRGI